MTRRQKIRLAVIVVGIGLVIALVVGVTLAATAIPDEISASSLKFDAESMEALFELGWLAEEIVQIVANASRCTKEILAWCRVGAYHELEEEFSQLWKELRGRDPCVVVLRLIEIPLTSYQRRNKSGLDVTTTVTRATKLFHGRVQRSIGQLALLTSFFNELFPLVGGKMENKRGRGDRPTLHFEAILP